MNPTFSWLRYLLLTSLLWSPAARAQWFADSAAETLYTSNLSRSERASDAQEDLALSMAARAGYHFQPATYTGLTVNARLSRTAFHSWSGLDNTEVAAGTTLSHKFGLGDRAPSVSVALQTGRGKYQNDIRDTWLHSAGLAFSKRLTDGFLLTATLRHERRDGDHNQPRPRLPGMPPPKPGNTWNYDVSSVSLQGELDLNENAWLTAGYSFQKGDIVSSSRTYPSIVAAAVAITDDPVYGPGVIAYRIPALAQSLSIDINRAVLDSATLYLGAELQHTRNSSGIRYRVDIVRAGLIYAF